ncbi:MAG TPA: MurR/RpiR family transcriptional regulator [Anaerolineae bacterium]|nr:MurR/RpiR family transcriptional regulator [Anaerolineae bacterium]
MHRERIKSAYADLSPSYQRLADFLMDHPYEAAFMTATQLGKQLEVDTATVVRFAQKLGYPGYPDLLGEVQAEVRERFARYFQPVGHGEQAADVFRASIRQDVTNIEQFDLGLDDQTLKRVADVINTAGRILVAGEGLSHPLANLLAYWLRLFRFNASMMSTEASVAAAELHLLGPQDLVIAIAVSPYCPDVTGMLQVTHEQGVQTVCLAGAESWPIARAADVCVVCPNANPMRIGSVVAAAAAIEALAQALFYTRRGDLAGDRAGFVDVLRRLVDARGKFDVRSLAAELEEAARGG